jgi:hypothetical protein
MPVPFSITNLMHMYCPQCEVLAEQAESTARARDRLAGGVGLRHGRADPDPRRERGAIGRLQRLHALTGEGPVLAHRPLMGD